MFEKYLDKNWRVELKGEFKKDYIQELNKFVMQEHIKNKEIFPPIHKTFTAFNLTKFIDTKVVILGQDPYHRAKQAHGLSFSVEILTKQPPSLLNIFKELEKDLGVKRPKHGNLEKWSKQGVLLLNSILTVEKGKPGSHANKGWERFTDNVLSRLCKLNRNLVFILWGKKAQEKTKFIDSNNNLIITGSHPSPFSAYKGFFGSNPFSKANKYLKENKIKPINWDLND